MTALRQPQTHITFPDNVVVDRVQDHLSKDHGCVVPVTAVLANLTNKIHNNLLKTDMKQTTRFGPLQKGDPKEWLH